MDEKEVALLESDLLESYETIERIYEYILGEQATFKDRVQDLNSMAYHLHNLYGAHEQLFEIIAGFFENQVTGNRYHADLLRRMKTEIKGVRPALISSITYESLDELRGFRHFFRHAYRAKLDADRIEKLVQIAIQLRDPFRQDMESFLEKLK
jgi:hypothetical protein